MIAAGLSDPGSGEGAGQVLREPPWDTEQALLPADARLHGREKLALQMLSIRHRVELIYFVGTFALCLYTAFVLVCILCTSLHERARVCVSERLRGVCTDLYVRVCA